MISDHNNERGEYITDIYAWDNAGNESGLAGRKIVDIPDPDTTKPVISSLKIVSKTDTQAVIEAEVSDNEAIDKTRTHKIVSFKFFLLIMNTLDAATAEVDLFCNLIMAHLKTHFNHLQKHLPYCLLYMNHI